MSEKNESNIDSDFEPLFARLAEPFGPDEIRYRPQGSRQIAYITARMVMNRLDDVVGPANWWDDYIPSENSVLCKLSIRLPNGTVLTKSDAGGYAGMTDSGDDDKSGYSDAYKRAAVKFGVGRHLYREGIPEYACRLLGLDNRDLVDKNGGGGYSSPAPQSRPGPGPSQGGGQRPQGGGGQRGGGGDGPKDIARVRTGKDLWGFVKDDKNLITQVNEFGKQMSFPNRMVEWSEEEVAEYKRHWNGEA